MCHFVHRLMAALAVSVICLAGCVSSQAPLSDANSSVPDLRLIGTWEFTGGTGKRVVEISRQKDSPNVLNAVGKNETLRQEKKANVFCTKLGDNSFVSIEVEEKNRKGYAIAKYEVSGDDTIKLSGLDSKFFEAAIKANQLNGKPIYIDLDSGESESGPNGLMMCNPNAGTMPRTTYSIEAFNLDDTAENLRTFIEKHGAKCFDQSPPTLLKRIKNNE
jgi:hypothetical protein